ncbi:MAG: 50S ribosomal protein L13 [Actinobacteria bacterium]|nr:50S ribosomal protein L13 [Actinomycetota bacterium]
MVNVGLKTFNLKKEEIKRKWFLINAEGKILGRLSTEIAKILRGKNKPIFTPHVDCGDYVIVINVDKIKVTGNKIDKKKYYRHSGYIGNLKVKNLKEMMEKSPELVLRNSVKGMIPHNILGRKVIKKLKIYAGENHPHGAQNPEKIEI